MIISIYEKLRRNALITNKVIKIIPMIFDGNAAFLMNRDATNNANATSKKTNNIG